jgi:lysophospholipase L1-like esterase
LRKQILMTILYATLNKSFKLNDPPCRIINIGSKNIHSIVDLVAELNFLQGHWEGFVCSTPSKQGLQFMKLIQQVNIRSFLMKYYLLLCIILILFGTFTWTHFTSASGTKAINLATLGDSITYGSGDPSKKGYVERFKVKFEEKKNIPIHVSNFGIPQYTTENILEQMNDRKIKKHVKKANYIILYVGTNDFRKSAGYQFNQLNVNKINEGKLIFSKNLHKIIDSIRNENSLAPIIVLGLYHPYVEYQNQQEILELIEEWNNEIDTVIGDFDQTFFVPTLDLFENKPKETYFSDSIHPNSSGYRLIANRLLKNVINLE